MLSPLANTAHRRRFQCLHRHFGGFIDWPWPTLRSGEKSARQPTPSCRRDIEVASANQISPSLREKEAVHIFSSQSTQVSPHGSSPGSTAMVAATAAMLAFLCLACHKLGRVVRTVCWLRGSDEDALSATVAGRPNATDPINPSLETSSSLRSDRYPIQAAFPLQS